MRSICGTPELSKRKFCDGLETFTSPLGQIQQACASEKLRKVLLLVLLSVIAITSGQIQDRSSLSLTSTRSLNLLKM